MSRAGAVERFRERFVRSASSTESFALLVGAAGFVLASLVALLVFGGRDIPISGVGSLGQFVAITGGILAFLTFVGTRVIVDRAPALSLFEPGGVTTPRIPSSSGGHAHARLASRVLDVVAIGFAHAIICLLLWTAIADILEKSFQDAVVYSIPALVLTGAAAAVTTYFVCLSALTITPVRLSAVLAGFLVIGAVTSMLTAKDPHWWKENLSALGMTDDLSAMTFNLTLIVAGVIVTTVARYATAGLVAPGAPVGAGARIVRWGLVAIGALLACVGVFPVDRFLLVHNTVATGMVVVFLGIVIGLPWLLPTMPRVFVAIGYVFIVVIVLTAVFFAIGYYNLTAVELVAAVLIFSWIIVFLRNASALSTDRADRADAAASVTRTKQESGRLAAQ
ncbi:hypothetical protein [Compostimonas suwonensis]|uniref:DUF998 domain-containing protein n=1 Tax=Compostimonas suwonensis TaxID=1048394 RepID=A0A2M9BWC1_9MICO|nr:hypothetical protein [Compostimonas suwonensis]PJJ62241.1 hypothetical protein CLV54_2038 [Compostimonas suwonensis]